MKKITIKDIKEKNEYEWLRTGGNWSIDRFLKKFFIGNDNDISGEKEDGITRIVDLAHVVMVFFPSFNHEKYNVEGSVSVPKIDLNTEMKVVGGYGGIAVVLEGEPGEYSCYSIVYFVPLVKTFGKVDRILSKGYDYPIRIEFSNGVSALLAPRIDTNPTTKDDIVFFDDPKAWLPCMFGKRNMSPGKKISYLYSLDPNISLGKALEMMEGEVVSDSNYKKLGKYF